MDECVFVPHTLLKYIEQIQHNVLHNRLKSGNTHYGKITPIGMVRVRRRHLNIMLIRQVLVSNSFRNLSD